MFQEAIAAVVDEYLEKDLSHTNFFSLSLDGSTDNAIDHSLVMCARYVLNGEVQPRFTA